MASKEPKTFISILQRLKSWRCSSAQDGEKFVEVKRAGDSQSVGVMYHVAAYSDKDYAAIDVLNNILTSDPSGYLYKALVDTHKIASIWATRSRSSARAWPSATCSCTKARPTAFSTKP